MAYGGGSAKASGSYNAKGWSPPSPSACSPLAPADAPWHPGFPSIPPTPPAQDQTGYAACPHAARKGHAETLRVLLSAGANPWLPDADGYTAYDYALDHAKPPAVVAALLEGDPRFAEVQRGFQVGRTGCDSNADKRVNGLLG